MQKFLYLLLWQLLIVTPFISAQQQLLAVVHFSHNEFELSDSAQVLLRNQLMAFPVERWQQLTLTGHTDSLGSAVYNLRLAEKRNLAVQTFLQQLGISSEKIEMQIYGQAQPVAPNHTEAGKQQNRRVEIWAQKGPWQQADPFAGLEPQRQFFVVDSRAPIDLTGQQGTRLHLPKNAFVRRNGTAVSGEVQIELREFYAKSDLVLGNLHSMSDGRLLETGGMIYIAATADGKELKLRPGLELEIDFGAGASLPGMGVFLGKEQDGQVNWRPQKSERAAQSAQVREPPIIKLRRREGRRRPREREEGFVGLSEEQRQVDRYLLRSNRLGWINCDRFYQFENKTELWVGVDTLFRPAVRLVFSDINAVMAASAMNDSTWVFRGVPVGLTATLLAFAVVNGEYFFVSRELVLTNNQRENLKLIKSSLTAIKQELRQLD